MPITAFNSVEQFYHARVLKMLFSTEDTQAVKMLRQTKQYGAERLLFDILPNKVHVRRASLPRSTWLTSAVFCLLQPSYSATSQAVYCRQSSVPSHRCTTLEQQLA